MPNEIILKPNYQGNPAGVAEGAFPALLQFLLYLATKKDYQDLLVNLPEAIRQIAESGSRPTGMKIPGTEIVISSAFTKSVFDYAKGYGVVEIIKRFPTLAIGLAKTISAVAMGGKNLNIQDLQLVMVTEVTNYISGMNVISFIGMVNELICLNPTAKAIRNTVGIVGGAVILVEGSKRLASHIALQRALAEIFTSKMREAETMIGQLHTVGKINSKYKMELIEQLYQVRNIDNMRKFHEMLKLINN